MDNPMIYKQICAVMGKITAIGKDRKNQMQGFQYRGIDDVMNELHGILAECKVFVVPEVLEESRSTGKSRNGGDIFYTRLKIKFTFYAEDGSSVQSVVIGEAMDSGDKASNKALSVGLKYALLQVFCIPTEDDKDPDATTPDVKPGSLSPEALGMKKASQVKSRFSGQETAEMKKWADGTFTPDELAKVKASLNGENWSEAFNKAKAEYDKRKAGNPPEEIF